MSCSHEPDSILDEIHVLAQNEQPLYCSFLTDDYELDTNTLQMKVSRLRIKPLDLDVDPEKIFVGLKD